MKNKRLTATIVIPVYNEEKGIDLCLNSIAIQTVMPNEVIVVDNNCTDKTIDIVKRYNFCKVVKETKQGRFAARNNGFRQVKTDLVCRIDGDSILPNNWLETVLRVFEGDRYVGYTGGLYFYDKPFNKLSTIIHKLVYFDLAKLIYGKQVFFGANMAFRAKFISYALGKSKDDNSYIHEDVDLSLAIAPKGRIKLITDNPVGVSFTKTAGSPSKLWRHLRMLFSYNKYRPIDRS